MRLPKTRSAKLKERILSLENHLGTAYVERDGYNDHILDDYGAIPGIKKELKNKVAISKEK